MHQTTYTLKQYNILMLCTNEYELTLKGQQSSESEVKLLKHTNKRNCNLVI